MNGAVEHGLNHAGYHLFKCLPQICTKMNNLKFDFSTNFWGGAHRAPSPDPSPRFFSGFALGSGFPLNSQALRAFDSGFVLVIRALRALDSGFALNFGSENLVCPPAPNKFLDPRLAHWAQLQPLFAKLPERGHSHPPPILQWKSTLLFNFPEMPLHRL